MSFTEKDLAKLKEQIAFHKEKRLHETTLNEEDLDALVARLEAAEAVIEAQSHTEHCVDEFLRNGCTCGFQKAIDAWRKACGR